MASDSKNYPSVEQVRELLDYDPATGFLAWRVARRGRGCQRGKRAGSKCSGGRYRCVMVNYCVIMEHVIVWALHYGEWPSDIVDHKDCDGLNNRIDNLRLASGSENAQNRRIYANNKSGFKGVHLADTKLQRPWRASISVNRKPICLGFYRTAEDAGAAYEEAAQRLFGEFARSA